MTLFRLKHHSFAAARNIASVAPYILTGSLCMNKPFRPTHLSSHSVRSCDTLSRPLTSNSNTMSLSIIPLIASLPRFLHTLASSSSTSPRHPYHPAAPKTKFLFISGHSSSSGKSSICMNILDLLMTKYGFKASELAYIKPATQCTATQGIWKYCHEKGIECEGIGSLIFYTGLTAERQETEDVEASERELLHGIEMKIAELSRGKRFVIVDGVGYPSVGSVVGASNAQIAQHMHAPVLLVGKDGLGDAVDTFNLNRSYFEVHKAKVLGCIFNRVLDIPYSSKYVNLYLSRHKLPHKAYGFLPKIEHSVEKMFQRCCGKGEVCKILPKSHRAMEMSEEEKKLNAEMNENFLKHVDWKALMDDVARYYGEKSV